MKKKIMFEIVFTILFSGIMYKVINTEQDIHNSCYHLEQSYRQAYFNLKIEKISEGRNTEIEGKDNFGRNIKWQDPSYWLFGEKAKIHIGDSLRKEMGTTTILVVPADKGDSFKIYFKCQDSIYR